MDSTTKWDFPLPRTHTGMLQGNAVLGAMIWGAGGVLRVTVGRADWWDHRGGLHWDERQSYANIRRCLEAGDDLGVRELFEQIKPDPGRPRRPTLLSVGRIELDFGPDATLQTGELRLADGLAVVGVAAGGQTRRVRLVMDMARPVVCLEWDEGLAPAFRCVPAWQYVGERLASVSYEPPTMIDEPGLAGWVQSTPSDESGCVGFRAGERSGRLTCCLGAGDDEAIAAAREALDATAEPGLDETIGRNAPWWSEYWQSVPTIDIPNDELRMLYEYGLYKFAGMTNPSGVAAGLQGPWIEEYQLPPWSGDYHFNINVQMCYWPAYRSNRLEHLKPLFDLIAGWTETLVHNAKVFVGIDDGYMLPHSVDDRCTCMGGFWTGAIDHGCTAWVAAMMFRYYRYSMDTDFLRKTAYPFMVAAMRVYEEMLEREGDTFVLPVSVSPEYRASNIDAWGRNASFQLACIHRLCEDLVEAAETLREPPRPIWSEILAKLPKACLIEDGDGHERIALWEGTPLEESHRHHSHMAAIVPFDVLDWEDPAWRPIIHRTYADWVHKGPGLWSGWCIPWASMLHSRVGHGQMAELLLEVAKRFYMNVGHGTLHNADHAGFSLTGRPPLDQQPIVNEVMQSDLGMAAVLAVQEMLLHTKRGVNYVFRGAPPAWKRVGFDRMRTDGAFLVSALRLDGRVQSISVESLAGGTFRLRNPWAGDVKATDDRGREVDLATHDAVIQVDMTPGQKLEIEEQP